ncbi:MAG TPA: YncE family protein [Candidatus Acidoferrales bacterium]
MSTPARNASVYKTDRIGRFAAFLSRSTARSAVLAACGAMLVAGCNQVGTGGLSSNLPPAGGGGLLSFVSVSMPDAIAGRAYSKVAVTSVETQSKTNFPISPAIASGTAPLASCTVTGGSLPPGMNAALTIDPTGSGCLINGTPSAGDAGNTYQFIIQALDSNSPPRAAAQTFSMKVRPEFTVTAPSAIVGGALPAGVQGRSYGQIAGNAAAFTATTDLSATNGNGPVGAKNYCALTVTPALPSLTMTQVAGTNNCMLQGTGVLAAAGSYKVSIALTDNPIVDPETNLAAVPANTIAGASNASLNVGSPLKIAAQADGVSATPPAAVQGRAYGTGTGCSGGACEPLTYLATGGLPSVEPADPYLFTDSGLSASGLTCTATAPSTVAKTTCSGTAGAPATTNFSVTVDDAGNLATPGGSASGTISTISGLSLTVDSTLSLAVSPDPAANPAVQNTAYGIGTGCTGPGGNCVAPTYTPSGGLGSYSFSVTGTPPAGIACAANVGNTAVACSGTASATAATSTFGVSASDVANASSPSASASPVSKTLTVNGALTLTPPVSVPTAVTGRAFGTGAGCSGGNCVPAIFTVSGGQGTYAATATIVSAPGTWACPLSGSQYNCSSASVGSGTTLSITASDGASATTPGQTTASASVPITINAAMAVTPLGGAASDAVTGRSYGSAASGCTSTPCTPIKYSVANGLGNYQPGSIAVADSASDSFACTVASLTYSCSSGAVNGSAISNAVMTMTAMESGNQSTPGGAATDSTRTISIQSALAISQSLGATWPDAVNGRSYGTGTACGALGTSPCVAAQFTASGGTGSYLFSTSNFPLPAFVCSGSPTYSCSSAGITSAAGTFHPQVTVQDGGDASTPSASVSTPSTTALTVDAALALTAPTGIPPTAVNGRGYGSNAPNGSVSNTCPGPTACQSLNFGISGGLGGYLAATIVSTPGTWSCPLVGSNYECATSSVVAAGPFPEPNVAVTLTASDTANSTTPAATTSNATASLTVNSALALTLPSQVSILTAVTGRKYGTGGGCTGGSCAPITFSVTGGLTTYAGGSLSDGADNFTCTGAGSYSCSIGAIAGSGTPTLTFSATENGNNSTPSGTVSDNSSRTLTIDQPITLTSVITIASPWPDAVNGRSYGQNGTTLQFNAANGIQPYVSYTASGLSSDFTCSVLNPTAGSCSSAGVTAAAGNTYNVSVAVSDTGNASTPPATTTTDPNSVVTNSLNVDSPLAVTTPTTLRNGLENYLYPTATLSASGGVAGSAYTWVGPGATSGACTSTLTGTIPSGLTLNSSSTTATITGTPSNASGGQYSFEICVTDTGDSMTPAGFAPPTTSNTLDLDVMTPYAVIAEETADEVELFNTLTEQSSALVSVGSGSPGNLPYGVAFSPSGRYAYVTLSGSDELAIFDTITKAQIASSPVSLATGCSPHGVAATTSLILVACNGAISGADYVAVVKVTNTGDTATFSVGTPIATTTDGAEPEGVAVTPDGSQAYVTLSNGNQLFAIAISGNSASAAVLPSPITNPFSLSSTVGTIPMGIAIAPALGTGASWVAYIAKQGATPNTPGVPDGVEVLALTGTGAFTTDASATTATTDSTAKPTYVAVTPDNTHVYVSYAASNSYAVFDNTQASAPLITTSPLTTSAATPQGIAIPVVSAVPSGSTFLAFICQTATNNLAFVDDKSTPAEDTSSPLPLSGTAPVSIASTPAPQ